VSALVEAAQLAKHCYCATPRAHTQVRPYEPRPTNHAPRTTNHESRITNHEPRTTNHEPRITSDAP